MSPNAVVNGDGSVKQPGLDNHAMGTIFEELVRRFNEENNEEAGEHWTPRDVVKLMSCLVFLPIADQIESGTYLLYDACGTGGMLTIAEETFRQLAEQHGKQVVTHLYGQEINSETYAIAKADLLLKGEGEAADNIIGGPEYSTLSNDAFPSFGPAARAADDHDRPRHGLPRASFGRNLQGPSGREDGLKIDNLRKAWTTACKRAGVGGRIVHDFRRPPCATWIAPTAENPLT